MLARSLLKYLPAALLAACAATAHAAAVPWIYQATAPAADQSAESRERALREALGTVLVRVTGDRWAAVAGPAQTLLPRAGQLVQGYGFEAGAAGGLELRAQFDARAVEAALRAQGLPVWGASRPTHLVWLALRDDGQPRALLDEAGAAARTPALLAAANARGIPLAFPRLEPDGAAPTVNEVFAGNDDPIREASRAYGADRVVVIRMGRSDGQWLGRWTLLYASGAQEEWSMPGVSLEQALAEGLHALADREAAQLALRASGSVRELRVIVSGVQSLADYARALNYLRGLAPVKAAAVDRVEQDRVGFLLRVEGEPGALERLIAAGAVLQADAAADGDGGLGYVLHR